VRSASRSLASRSISSWHRESLLMVCAYIAKRQYAAQGEDNITTHILNHRSNELVDGERWESLDAPHVTQVFFKSSTVNLCIKVPLAQFQCEFVKVLPPPHARLIDVRDWHS
jgi:hypothetical protein